MLSSRTHQINIDTVIYQIVHSRLDALWRAEVNSVQFANPLDIFPASRQSYHSGMKLREVCFEYLGGVTCGIAGYEYGEDGGGGG